MVKPHSCVWGFNVDLGPDKPSPGNSKPETRDPKPTGLLLRNLNKVTINGYI